MMLLGSVVALIAVPALAAPRAPTVLAPASKWNLHYADQSCQLKRTFGDPANPTSLVFERIDPGSGMSMMVYGDPLRARSGLRNGKAAFLPFVDHPFEEGSVAETVANKKIAILWTSVDFLAGAEKPPETKPGEPVIRDPSQVAALRATETANAARVTGVQVTEPGGRKIVLATGPLEKVMEAMRNCAREQLAAWGVDPDVEERIVRSATPIRPLASLFSWSDYPVSALPRGEESIVKARLNIGADGLVTRCTSLTAFRGAGFAEVTCKNLQQARFQPAQLADGTRVPSYTVANVRFQMP
ncbi:energy transducer TonB [Sphingomonas sp. LHG3406-1]|uniref:energy transducer TonB n=1 Tax=Sphingomonas sp. LHG3406-1 TaxID=2804617 RepID=UPI002629500A|nr:energy transducer TonB [Sphingomonas sp. LHG3406-1]